jgi:hypothetical protein
MPKAKQIERDNFYNKKGGSNEKNIYSSIISGNTVYIVICSTLGWRHLWSRGS